MKGIIRRIFGRKNKKEWKRVRCLPRWVEKRAVNTLTPFHKMYIKGRTFWYKAYYYVGNIQGDSGIVYWRKLRHKRKKSPLQRKGKKWYWKGISLDDDTFTGGLLADKKMISEYNRYIRKLKKQKSKK